MSKISICIDTDEKGISTITQNKDSVTIKIEKKVDRSLELESKGLSVSSESQISKEENKLDSIQVGKLTDEEMKRFNLGSYSNKSTPGSTSL